MRGKLKVIVLLSCSPYSHDWFYQTRTD